MIKHSHLLLLLLLGTTLNLSGCSSSPEPQAVMAPPSPSAVAAPIKREAQGDDMERLDSPH